jgi:enoyl-CoA hydratase/carnithine racemase
MLPNAYRAVGPWLLSMARAPAGPPRGVADADSVTLGVTPGGGAAQHVTRLMGHARALEVMLSAGDYDADLAERYGWINRAMPANALDDFVSSIARQIASFPATGRAVVKEGVNAIALAPLEDFRRDSDLFGEGIGSPEAHRQIAGR